MNYILIVIVFLVGCIDVIMVCYVVSEEVDLKISELLQKDDFLSGMFKNGDFLFVVLEQLKGKYNENK